MEKPMNLLNNQFHQFVNSGTDEAIIKSMDTEGVSDDLVKAMSKEGLVQKDVTYKTQSGKMATRKQWVKASEDQNENKEPTKPVDEQKTESSSKPKLDDKTVKVKPEDIKVGDYVKFVGTGEHQGRTAVVQVKEITSSTLRGITVYHFNRNSTLRFAGRKGSTTIEKYIPKEDSSQPQKSDSSEKSNKKSVGAADFKGMSTEKIRGKLNEMEPGTEISGVAAAPGTHWAGHPTTIKKVEGYTTNYGAMARYGGSVRDNNQKETWWEVNGSKQSEFDVADILAGKSKYYVPAEKAKEDSTKETKESTPKNKDKMLEQIKTITKLRSAESLYDAFDDAVNSEADDKVANLNVDFVDVQDVEEYKGNGPDGPKTVDRVRIKAKVKGEKVFKDGHKERFETETSISVKKTTTEKSDSKPSKLKMDYDDASNETWYEGIMEGHRVRVLQEKVGDNSWWNVEVDGKILKTDNDRAMSFKSAAEAEQEASEVCSKTSQPKQKEPQKAKKTESSSQSKANYFKASQATKDKVDALGKEHGNDRLLEMAKQQGVNWTEHNHKGINVMRAKMAIAQAMEEGKWKSEADSSSVDKGFDKLMKQGVYELETDPDDPDYVTDALVVHQNGKIYRENDQSNPSEVSKEEAKKIIGAHQQKSQKK